MLRRAIAICGFAAAGLLCTATAKAEPLDAAAWHFRVTFPCPSTLTSQTADSAVGKIVVTIYSCGDDNAAFLVAINDYPAGTIKPEEIETRYAGIVNGMASNANGTIRTVGAYVLANVSGREVVIDIPGKQGAMKARFFLIGDRLYQVTCIGKLGTEIGQPCKAFLDSFTVIGTDKK